MQGYNPWRNFGEFFECELPRMPRMRTSPKRSSTKFAPPSSRWHYAWRWKGSAVLLDPVAFLILLILVLNCAPGNTVGAIFLTVLLFGGVEGLLVDLLGSLGKVVLDVVRKLCDLLVGHRVPLGSGAISKRRNPSGRRAPRSRCQVGNARLLMLHLSRPSALPWRPPGRA